MLSKIAVDVKDVTSVVDVTMRDTVLSAMVELDVTWTLPKLIHIYIKARKTRYLFLILFTPNTTISTSIIHYFHFNF